MKQACELCPRRCGVDRLAGERGFCRAGALPVLYRYAPHDGEEPPVSGERGSGTLFFSHCTLACLYCQNYPWSQAAEGDVYDHAALCDALRRLARHGCHNWNLVSPTPWLPWVREAVRTVRAEGISLPVVYNTSGYERVETLTEYATELAQVYLADLRYANPETAHSASQAADYVACARESLRFMWSQRGPLQLDENGVALYGVICRLLILPGRADEVVANLEWVARTLGTDVPVSVMAQYRPAFQAMASKDAVWGRGVSRAEYDRVCECVESLGFETGWIQEFEGTTKESLVGHQMPRGAFEP